MFYFGGITGLDDKKVTVDTSTTNGVVDIDCDKSSFYEIDISGDTTININNLDNGSLNIIALIVKNGGNSAITWPSDIKWVGPQGSMFMDWGNLGITLKTDGSDDFIIIWSDGVNKYARVMR